MDILEKYEIRIIDGKRYYLFDMTTELPSLEETIPFCFKYKSIEIYETAWNRMSLKILESLDKRTPRSEQWYLDFKYEWSNSPVFSKTKRVNFTKFKNIYLNTNHTATHAMMSIQYLLIKFRIPLELCTFIIRRHPSTEPEEAREYFRRETIADFKSALRFRKFSEKKIETVISNFKQINRILAGVSHGFDDFFLFDDYSSFYNYKVRVNNLVFDKYYNNPEYVNAVEKTLAYLDNFYKNRNFYENVSSVELSPLLKTMIKKEIDFLFENLDSRTVVLSKLYSRMCLMHESLMESLGPLNNNDDFFKIAEALVGSTYYFKYPFISLDNNSSLTNDEMILSYVYSLDDFTINNINDYADKMHLKRFSNYIQMMIDISKDYIQVEQSRMISKNIFTPPKAFLDRFANEILFYINSFGSIDFATYEGYVSLPDFGYPWNKYFIVGLVRSYFSDIFKISYFGSSYRTVDFKITLQSKNQ